MTLNATKREYPRRLVDPPLSMNLVGMSQAGWGEERQIDCRCVDVSSSGVGMTTNNALREGDVLKLHFSVADLQVTLPVLTKVIWARQEADQYRVGLHFLA